VLKKKNKRTQKIAKQQNNNIKKTSPHAKISSKSQLTVHAKKQSSAHQTKSTH
jgi:hypothetical protein